MTQQQYYEHTSTNGNTRKYRIVNSIEDVPLAYCIWNIGRRNFPLEKHIPMCRVDINYNVDINTLLAVPMDSEEIALELMKQSHYGTLTAAEIKGELKQWQTK